MILLEMKRFFIATLGLSSSFNYMNLDLPLE